MKKAKNREAEQFERERDGLILEISKVYSFLILRVSNKQSQA